MDNYVANCWAEFRAKSQSGEYRSYRLEIRRTGKREFQIDCKWEGQVVTGWQLKTNIPQDLAQAQKCAWETAVVQLRFSNETAELPDNRTEPDWHC
jgi:hypothetical protein